MRPFDSHRRDLDRSRNTAAIVYLLTVSLVLEDRTWNLVAACRKCNNEKRDRLTNIEALESLCARNKAIAEGRIVAPVSSPIRTTCGACNLMNVAIASGSDAALALPCLSAIEPLHRNPVRRASAPGKDCILTDKEVWVAAHLLPRLLPVNQRMQAPAEPRCWVSGCTTQ